MKREEAIANLNHIYGMVAPDMQRSLDVAIKALENPTGDCISREALKEEFKRIYRCAETAEQLANNMEDAIDNAPPVPQGDINEQTYKDAYDQGYADGWKERYGEPDGRPKGKWIITREEQGPCGIIYKTRKCNQCYWENSLLIPRNFCPKCGADMREERGEEK